MPGDTIRLGMNGTVQGSAVPVSLWLSVRDDVGNSIADLSFDNYQTTIGPSSWHYDIIRGIPISLASGQYTFRGELHYNGQVQVKQVPFTVVDLPPGWTPDQWDTKSSFAFDSTVSHTGSNAARIISTEPNDARWTQHVAVNPNTDYVLSGWVKTNGVSMDFVGANIGLVDDTSRTGDTDIRGTQDWTYIEFPINSGNRTDFWVGARLGHFSNTTTGTAWFDDLSLREQTLSGLGSNLLQNPGFENQ